jgi:hypothetical protein
MIYELRTYTFNPGKLPAYADEVPFVSRTLQEPAVRGPDGVVAPFAPHREQEAGADRAKFRVVLGVTVRLRLDAAVEGRLAEMAESDGGDVEIDGGRHVVANRHVHGQALERVLLADVPPGIHQMPGHRSVLLLVFGRLLVTRCWGQPTSEQHQD